MHLAFLAVMYFFVVVIITLAFLLIREKQMMYKLFDEKEILQDELAELKIERVRINHLVKMQDESIVHLMDGADEQENSNEVDSKANKEPADMQKSEQGSKEKSQPKESKIRIETVVKTEEKPEAEVKQNTVSKVEKKEASKPKQQSEVEAEIEAAPIEEPFIFLDNHTLSQYYQEEA